MDKVDYKKELKTLYKASGKVCAVVAVPPMRFLMVDGCGDPNISPWFQDAVEALFSVSYTAKFMVKKALAVDYGVMPLEGLWWCDDMSRFSTEHKADWQWTVMIMQPGPVTDAFMADALAKVRKDKRLPALDEMRFVTYDEGLSAQILHTGPFSAEGATVEKLHAFIAESGYNMTGKHHEIYLSDTRRGDPKNWKTIIRQPVAK